MDEGQEPGYTFVQSLKAWGPGGSGYGRENLPLCDECYSGVILVYGGIPE